MQLPARLYEGAGKEPPLIPFAAGIFLNVTVHCMLCLVFTVRPVGHRVRASACPAPAPDAGPRLCVHGKLMLTRS